MEDTLRFVADYCAEEIVEEPRVRTFERQVCFVTSLPVHSRSRLLLGGRGTSQTLVAMYCCANFFKSRMKE